MRFQGATLTNKGKIFVFLTEKRYLFQFCACRLNGIHRRYVQEVLQSQEPVDIFRI